MDIKELKSIVEQDRFRILNLLSLDKNSINKNLPSHKEGYICPRCGSGTGKTGTGIKQYEEHGTRFKCFKCDFNGDLIDLYALIKDINQNDNKAKIQAVKELYGLNDTYTTPNKKQYRKDIENKTEMEMNKSNNTYVKKDEKKSLEYINYINTCKSKLTNEIKESLLNRGIHIDFIDSLNVGYDDKKNALILPAFENYEENPYYFSKNLEEGAKWKKLPTSENNEHPLYRQDLIKSSDKPLFITEGQDDTISFLQFDLDSVSLCGTNNTDKFIKYIEKNFNSNNPLKRNLFICLDNDEAGKEAQEKLLQKLNELQSKGIILSEVIEFNYGEDYVHKDINEHVQAEYEKIKNDELSSLDFFNQYNLNSYKEKILNSSFGTLINENVERKKREYLKSICTRDYQEEYFKNLENIENKAISSGFSLLDKFLNGGFKKGIYILGASTGQGKTTLALNFAMNIAKQGKHVLYFSLEMYKEVVVSKLISHLTCKETGTEYIKRHEVAENEVNPTSTPITGKTTKYSGLTVGEIMDKYPETKNTEMFKNASGTYFKEYAHKIHIVPCVENGGTTIEEIEEHVNKFIEYTGETPFIIIDYLQEIILSDKGTEKQAIDHNVRILRKITNNNNVPMLVISALNRESENNKATLSGFKESGKIEYCAEVCFTLQYNFYNNEYVPIKSIMKEISEDEFERLPDEEKGARFKEINKSLKEFQDNEGMRKKTQIVQKEFQQKREADGLHQSLVLSILKNRSGNNGDIHFKGVLKYNTFLEHNFLNKETWKLFGGIPKTIKENDQDFKTTELKVNGETVGEECNTPNEVKKQISFEASRIAHTKKDVNELVKRLGINMED